VSTDVGPSFAELLRRHRAASGLSQEALSARSAISVDAISMLERGVRSFPRNSTVVRLAEALRLRPPHREAFIAAAQRPPELAVPTRRRAVEFEAGSVPPALGVLAGREPELTDLERLLRRHGHVSVHGPAGIGASRLAAECARAQARHYPDGVLYLRGVSPCSLAGNLAGLTVRLGLPEQTETRHERQVEAVVRWLRRHRRWLLVLDDLGEASVPFVRRWLAPGLPGHVLEVGSASSGVAGLAVGPLTLEHARGLLLERTGSEDPAAAERVAELVGRVPLALQLAAAYVASSAADLSGYAELLGAADGRVDPVALTVPISLARAGAEHPGVPALLDLCAFLAPDGIPLRLLRSRCGDLAGAEPAAGLPVDEADLGRAIDVVCLFALGVRRRDELQVHPAVQATVRGALSADRREAWLSVAARLLEAHFPEEAEGHSDQWPLCARLLPHVESVDRAIDDQVLEPRSHARLLDRAAGYLEVRGEQEFARPLRERALTICERAFGPDDTDSVESVYALAALLNDQGELVANRPILRRALTRALAAGELAPRVRDALEAALAATLDTEVDRVYPTRRDALPDIRRDLMAAGDVRLLSSRGNELQRETFEHLLFKRHPDRMVAVRVLLPVADGSDQDTYWMRARESEMGRFDPSFRPGMLATQIEANIRFLMPYVEVGAVELRTYNSPHVGRVLLTDTVCYLTLYRSDAHGRDSMVIRYRSGPTYDWLSRYFEMIWESSAHLEQ
jgi:transcriptional regulator with XRE-family HTH domain